MTAGVFQILNRLTNDRFIGCSVNAEGMLGHYARTLNNLDRKFPEFNEFSLSSKLSEDWFDYGEESFSLNIIESTSPTRSVIGSRKRFWCRLLQPAYNHWRYSPIITGVYQIVSIKDSQSYVGQSKDIYERWIQHRGALRAGTHANRHLQASFNKWGESSFELRILEVYQPDLKPLVELEKSWIKKTGNLFNIVV